MHFSLRLLLMWLLVSGWTYPVLAGESTQRVAVLPLSAMATPQASCAQVRNQLGELLVARFEVELVPGDESDKAVRGLCGEESLWWDCLAREENLFALGESLEAKTVIAGRLATMGEKRVLKLRIVDVEAGRVSAEIISLPKGEENNVLTGVLLLHERLFPQQDTSRWYQRWEFWTIAGAGLVLVAGAVAIGLTVTSDGQNAHWDVHRSLP